MSQETVLITGASAGLGRTLTQLFAADGSDLVLVARRGERLEALANELHRRFGIAAYPVAADLEDPGAPERLVQTVHNLGLQVDVLVNNAGFGLVGNFLSLPLDRQMAMIQIDAAAVVHLTGLLLPAMVARQRGGVLNVSSTAAFQAGPSMAVYYATKAFVQSFSEALYEETRGTGVTVSTFAPGAIATEFGVASGMDRSRLFRSHAMRVQAVAEIGHRAFRRGEPFVIPGIRNRLATLAVKWMSRARSRRIVQRLKADALR